MCVHGVVCVCAQVMFFGAARWNFWRVIDHQRRSSKVALPAPASLRARPLRLPHTDDTGGPVTMLYPMT